MFFLPFIISIVFFILYNYATNTADIGEEENIKFNPSAEYLFKENEHIDWYDIDKHIKERVIPCYCHQELYYRISNYQKKEDSFGPAFIIMLFLSISGAFAFISGGLEPIWGIIISLIINAAIYFLVALLFAYTPIFKKLKLKNYSDVCDTYLSEYHYKYLKEIEESVMLRYFLRKIIGGIAMVMFLLNIWSSDTY